MVSKISNLAGGVALGVAGNALWSGITTGAIMSAILALYGYLGSHPEWLDRGITALLTCAFIGFSVLLFKPSADLPSDRLYAVSMLIIGALMLADIALRRGWISAPVPPPLIQSQSLSSEQKQTMPLYLLSKTFGWPKSSKPLKEVWGQHYTGVTIPLDGYLYRNCTFDHVIFDYEGKLPTGGWTDSFVSNAALLSGSASLKTYSVLLASMNINPASSCMLVPPSPPPLYSPKNGN